MSHYVGLDISVKKTAVCVIDEEGGVCAEAKVDSDPSAIYAALSSNAGEIKLVGLEAGNLSTWLYRGLEAYGLPVICIETYRMKTFAAASLVKTDRKDAFLIAQAMRGGLYSPVFIKSERSQRWRMLLIHRRALALKIQDLESVLRGTLRGFGLKVGLVSQKQFESRVRALATDDNALWHLVAPVLGARRAAMHEFSKLDGMVTAIAKANSTARLLMSVPGVGPITALAYIATIDDPRRFKSSAMVGPHLGLTPRVAESGDSARPTGITHRGDMLLRQLLYGAALSHLTRCKTDSDLKHWGQKIRKRRGTRRALVAMARKLAVILHRMWMDGAIFQPTHCVY
jgi:transposase